MKTENIITISKIVKAITMTFPPDLGYIVALKRQNRVVRLRFRESWDPHVPCRATTLIFRSQENSQKEIWC